ncbi:MAG: hypothetical protein RLZZ303_503 [Candidatus Hydrogenedentota bacterium]
MSTARLDAMRKIEVPGGKPGELFRIEEQAPGKYTIERIDEPAKHRTIEDVYAAIDKNPICANITWEELRKITREI